MNRYETFFIFDQDIPEDDRESISEKLKSLIPQQNGFLLLFDDWGSRKLAYEIQKKMHGHYIRLDYCGNGELVNALERFFRLDFRIIKFMTICVDKDADPEALKREITESQPEAESDQKENLEDSSVPDMASDEPSETETTIPETEEGGE